MLRESLTDGGHGLVQIHVYNARPHVALRHLGQILADITLKFLEKDALSNE
jgi:hypothetical protein